MDKNRGQEDTVESVNKDQRLLSQLGSSELKLQPLPLFDTEALAHRKDGMLIAKQADFVEYRVRGGWGAGIRQKHVGIGFERLSATACGTYVTVRKKKEPKEPQTQ
jgi:hypothetical protein